MTYSPKSNGQLRFHRVNAPTSKELNALVATISECVARYLERQGWLARDDTATLQPNLILSHCAGVGDATDTRVVRLMMILQLLTLGRGASGVRWELIEAIENLLSSGIVPIAPSQGSVGASGDLAPLAHSAAVLMGEGDASYNGVEQSAEAALRAAELKPLVLIAKEGLGVCAAEDTNRENKRQSRS